MLPVLMSMLLGYRTFKATTQPGPRGGVPGSCRHCVCRLRCVLYPACNLSRVHRPSVHCFVHDSTNHHPAVAHPGIKCRKV